MVAPPCSIWCTASWWILSPCSSGCGQVGSAPQVHQDLSSGGECPPPQPCPAPAAVGTAPGQDLSSRRSESSPLRSQGKPLWRCLPRCSPHALRPWEPVSGAGRSPGTSNAEAEPSGCCGWMGWEPSASQHPACGICSRKIASPRGMS